jgi:methyltransferase
VVSLWLYTGFILLLAAERLFELGLSRRNARLAFARGGREYGLGHYRAMVVLHSGFLVACLAEPWLIGRAFPGAVGWLALAGALLARGMRYWTMASLGEHWNARVIVVPGAVPVTTGPYRFLRHPNYAAVVLELLCVPMIHGAVWTALFFSAANAVLLGVRIRVEEGALGRDWQQAFAGKPRFVPGGRLG